MSIISPSDSHRPSITWLPFELHIQILSYLPLSAQIFAAECCSAWRQVILNDRSLRRSRYLSHPTLPSIHGILSADQQFGFIHEDNQVKSFRYYKKESIETNKELDNEKWDWEPAGKHPRLYYKIFVSRKYDAVRMRKLEISKWADISNSPLIDETIFSEVEAQESQTPEAEPLVQEANGGSLDSDDHPISLIEDPRKRVKAMLAVKESQYEWIAKEIPLDFADNPTIREFVHFLLNKLDVQNSLEGWGVESSRRFEVLFWIDRGSSNNLYKRDYWQAFCLFFNKRYKVRTISEEDNP